MKIRDLLMIGAVASFALNATAAMASEATPLPAGGPAAQSEWHGMKVGTLVEVGGAIFVVTVAGLVLFDQDNDKVPGVTPPTTTTSPPTTTTSTTTSTSSTGP